MVDDHMRGRVMSIFTVSFFGIAPVGSLAAGTASNELSPRITLLVCSFVIFAVGIFVLLSLKRQAAQRHPAEEALNRRAA
jgi:hypothetical protein